MKINRREAEMMDVVLEAFDDEGMLSQEELLLLFDNDEQIVTGVVSLLERSGLVEITSLTTIKRLPQAVALMQNGGLVKQYDAAASEPVQNNQHVLELEMQVRKLEAQNQKLGYFKGLVWLLGILVIILAIWIAEIYLHKHHVR